MDFGTFIDAIDVASFGLGVLASSFIGAVMDAVWKLFRNYFEKEKTSAEPMTRSDKK